MRLRATRYRARHGSHRGARAASTGLHRRVPLAILAALAGVRFPADAGFIATASVVCASIEIEPCDIAPVEKRSRSRRGLDFLDRHGLRRAKSEFEQAAKGHVALRLVV